MDAFLSAMKDFKLADGHDRVVRHGHSPERAIHTGVGPVEMRRAKLHDRGADEGGDRLRLTSAILPR